MKKTILFSLLLLNLSVYAQLNNRFYSVGTATNVSAIGAYGINSFLDWRQIQQYPTSAYNWSYADGLIQANQSAGLQTILTLRCVHPINADDSTSGTCAYQFDNGTTDDNSNWPLVGADTTKWRNFIQALVDRYDGDSNNDMPGLMFPIRQWHIIGQEYSRTWCSQYPDTSLASAQEFVKLVNMTYHEIKSKQPNSQISFAGLTSHKTSAFYDGYYNETTYCVGNCINNTNLTHSQLALSSSFLAKRRNTLYLMQHAEYDELDVHEYGEWYQIAEVVKWLKDSASLGNKPVSFLEGGGPYCKACENIYHSVNDTDGILPSPLIRDNASYVVYYFITGLASGVSKLHWHLFQEYTGWGTVFGDLDLLSINNIPKPSAYVYRFLAKTIFSNANADTVVRVTESNPNLYHYQIQPLLLDVAWSTNPTDSIIVSGTGTLERWDIPTTCDSLYPTYCDSLVQQSSVNVNGSYTIHLNDEVPVFYSWNDVLTGIKSSDIAKNSSVKIYPNPFSNSTTLQIMNGVNTNYELMIYDLFGREVKKYEIINQKTEISKGNLPSGMYFYQLKDNKQIISSGKLIIQ